MRTGLEVVVGQTGYMGLKGMEFNQRECRRGGRRSDKIQEWDIRAQDASDSTPLYYFSADREKLMRMRAVAEA